MTAASLDELSKLAAEFNAESEGLNTQISIVNNALSNMNIGIELWLEGKYPEAGEYQTWHEDCQRPKDVVRWYDVEQLGYAKIEDKWQLAVRFATSEEMVHLLLGNAVHRLVDVGKPRPLLKTSRAVRINSLALVPDLTDKLKATLERSIATLRKARGAADKL
jgi:hypothetical protein